MGPTPDNVAAEAIAAETTGLPATGCRRFTAGLAHWVYEVFLEGADPVVVKLAAFGEDQTFDASVEWAARLIPLGVPLPRIERAGVHRGFPFLVMARLPGSDLGTVYRELSSEQKQRLAAQMIAIQRKVHTLPRADGFGFTRTAGPTLLPGWRQVLEQRIDRSRQRIEGAGLVSPDVLEPLPRALASITAYCSSVEPTPFLDDTTTKNVLVHRGALTGVVDVDWICYGDPLLVVALTRVSLLNAGHDTEYTDAWEQQLQLNGAQRQALGFYAALFCADFLGELGQTFNGQSPSCTAKDVARLTHLLRTQLTMVKTP